MPNTNPTSKNSNSISLSDPNSSIRKNFTPAALIIFTLALITIIIAAASVLSPNPDLEENSERIEHTDPISSEN